MRATYEDLLNLVADRPEGEKVNIPALVRAFTPTQGAIIAAIDRLIADGKLDAKSLRKAEKPTNLLKLTAMPAAGHDPEPEPPAPEAVDDGGGDDARCSASPPQRKWRGDELHAQLVAFIAKHGLETSMVAMRLFGDAARITTLRYVSQPKPKTVEKILAFIAGEPSAELKKKPRHARGKAARSSEVQCAAKAVDLKVNAPRDLTKPPELPLTMLRDREMELAARQAQATKRKIRARARKALAAGISPADASRRPDVRGAMKEIRDQQEEADRLADPVEQAKAILRRRYRPVVAAEIMGGTKGKFVVGRKLVTKAELIEMARKAA